MNEFEESRPEFLGFNAYYKDEILVDLIAEDLKRKPALARYRWMMVWVVLTALLVGGGIAFVIKNSALVVVAVFAIFFGGSSWAYSHLAKVKAATKSILVGKICDFIGWRFQEGGFSPIPLDDFIAFGLLRQPTRSSFEDEMSGMSHGVNFVMHEAHLERKSDDKYVTTFRGVLIRMGFSRRFTGTTVLLRDAGIFNRKKKKGLKRVGLAYPKFEKIFEAYGSDQVEARYLLDPAFMQRLVDLEGLLSGKKLRAAFIGGELLIAIEAPNQFEAGTMRKSLTDSARTQKILGEISTVLEIVDGLLKK